MTRVLSSTLHVPLQPPRVLTHHIWSSTITPQKWRGTSWWRCTFFLILHAYTEEHRSRALIATPEKIYQRFPLLHTRGLSSSLSFISSLHTLLTTHKHTFPFHKLSRSLSLKSEKTKNGENSVALCAVCASSFGYRQPTDEQPIQRARARVLWHLPCRFRNLRHHLHSRYLSGFLILCSSFVCVALVVVFNYV